MNGYPDLFRLFPSSGSGRSRRWPRSWGSTRPPAGAPTDGPSAHAVEGREPGDLRAHGGDRRAPASHPTRRHRHGADVVTDRPADRVRLRPRGAAANLRDGQGRRERAPAHLGRLSHAAPLVAEGRSIIYTQRGGTTTSGRSARAAPARVRSRAVRRETIRARPGRPTGATSRFSRTATDDGSSS